MYDPVAALKVSAVELAQAELSVAGALQQQSAHMRLE